MSDVKVRIDPREFEKLLGEFINENAESIARDVAADAKRRCPVKTGKLKKSIRARKSRFEDGGWIVSASRIEDSGRYAINIARLMEFGGPNTAKKSFLRPALDANIASAKRKFGVK